MSTNIICISWWLAILRKEILNPKKQGVEEQTMKDALKKLYYLKGQASHIVLICYFRQIACFFFF